MPKSNVDTDAIIAVQHVYTLKKSGLGKYLFHRWRYTPNGEEVSDFVLNRPPFRNASVLIAGSNFGCGSSREHAVWALADFGIRCIIAPSFASILYENCIKNGILPVSLDESLVERLMNMLERGEMKNVTVDLVTCQITFPDESIHPFAISAAHRQTLIEGLDPIAVLERYLDDISEFQKMDRQTRPWVWPSNN